MLKVYNTMTRRKEEFKPLKKGEVSIYCCGVTPYNHPHIGNARPFVTWDVIRRYFAKKGYKVHYIQNFTDVDDKIINDVEGHLRPLHQGLLRGDGCAERPPCRCLPARQ